MNEGDLVVNGNWVVGRWELEVGRWELGLEKCLPKRLSVVGLSIGIMDFCEVTNKSCPLSIVGLSIGIIDFCEVINECCPLSVVGLSIGIIVFCQVTN
jgi:hypothetical protein